MEQKIFDVGLPLETVSLYLLCCALADADTPISTRSLLAKWNADRETLTRGLDTLVERKILEPKVSDRQGNSVYRVLDATQWEIDA